MTEMREKKNQLENQVLLPTYNLLDGSQTLLETHKFGRRLVGGFGVKKILPRKSPPPKNKNENPVVRCIRHTRMEYTPRFFHSHAQLQECVLEPTTYLPTYLYRGGMQQRIDRGMCIRRTINMICGSIRDGMRVGLCRL